MRDLYWKIYEFLLTCHDVTFWTMFYGTIIIVLSLFI